MTTSRTARRILAATSLAALAAGALSLPPALAAEGGVTQERLLNADKEEGNWIQHHKNFAGHRFSTLTQINKDNVKGLKVAWTMALGGIESGGIWSHGGLEGTPIVENGMMFVTDGWGSVYKIDTRGGEGKLLWKMDPKTDREWDREWAVVACCGVNNRGVALWGDLVVSHTLDGRLIATNKETGQVAWQRQVADPDKGETITGAPLIVKGMAISGVGGAEYGIRGWIAATDLKTEKEVWRTHTIPGKGEPGYETWKGNNNAAVSGGGSTWVTGTYDPDTDTIVWGTGNPGPDWDNAYRPATTSTPTRRSPSTRRPARSSGTSSTRRTTPTTMTACRRTSWSMPAAASSPSRPTATATPTRSTAPTASSSGRRRSSRR